MYNSSFKGDVCSHSHSFVLDNFIRKIFQNPKRIIGPYIQPGDTVIDLGCGPGYFSIDMAKMVGDDGRVFAVDIQEQMLSKVAHKSVLNNLTQVVRLHQCTQEEIGLDKKIKANFILAFYMVHETLDQERFFAQVKNLLHPQGSFLIVEPPFHVSQKRFEKITQNALDHGFQIKGTPRGKGGKSILLTL
ncbi:MAG: methyltransferase domain-containing protein [Desulfobacter sp.]|nr:methyltransferase domain-containing protein [Desulfobacter sp.]WDP87367.1 MAG: methyltransferase domain-containing protein [Desulfobacter sp.]